VLVGLVASPSLRWAASYPGDALDVWRVHRVGVLVRQIHAQTGVCPDPAIVERRIETTFGQCRQGSETRCIRYTRPPDVPFDDCALHYQTGFFGDDRHIYLTVRDKWTDRSDWFEGGEVWQLMTPSERAKAKARQKSD
jgi:hypothetical protein